LIARLIDAGPNWLDRLVDACDRDVALTHALIGFMRTSTINSNLFPNDSALFDCVFVELIQRAELATTAADQALILESLAALDAFEDDASSTLQAMTRCAGIYPQPNGSALLRLGFLSPHGAVIWQRFQISASRTLLAIWLEVFTSIDFASIEHDSAGRWAPGPLFRYHPERFRQSRRYAQRAAASYRPHARVLTLDELNAQTDLIVTEINQRSNEVDRRAKLQREAHSTIVFEAEEQLLMAWLNYRAAGRQLFELPSAMVDLLRRTDADDIPVGLIRAPYPAIYLHFGPQLDLEFEPGWRADGVYVEHYPDHQFYSFAFTAIPDVPADINTWHAFGEPVAVVHFTEQQAGMDLGTAIDHALSDLLHQLAQERADGELAATLPSHNITVTTGPRAARQIEILQRRQPAMKAALQLAVNALCYLTAYPDDAVPIWPKGTPAALLHQATAAGPKERAKANVQLAALGYTKVHLCGAHFTGVTTDAPHAATTGVRPHWRRGHWRRQPHGAGGLLRKLIWLMPTMVHRDAAPDEVPGHIYMV
jgi:hypothetical protein